MSLKPSIAPESLSRLAYVKRVSITVFLVAVAVTASGSFLPKVELTHAESLSVAIEPTNTPIPIPSPNVTPAATASPSPSPAIRILSQYENGGTVTVSGNDVVREAALTQARTFLLRKWRDRGRGRLILVPHQRGLTPRPRSFYIEPNPSGVWRITLEMDGDDPAEFYVVEEIGVDANGQPILTPRPGGPQAVTRALHLKQQGNVKHGMVF